MESNTDNTGYNAYYIGYNTDKIGLFDGNIGSNNDNSVLYHV